MINEDLGQGRSRKITDHFLTNVLKRQRHLKAKAPLWWHIQNGHTRIVCTDEKVLTLKNLSTDKINVYMQ